MKMIAHRGYSKFELENTVEAFVAAANRSYFGIETDITVLKDKEMVLFHDDNLQRLAGIDAPIREYTMNQIEEVVLNVRPTYHTFDLKIAKPLEYIRICKHYNKTPIIELKWGFEPSDVDKVMNMLYEEEMFDKSMIICFTYSIVLYIREKYPTMRVQYLLGMLYTEEVINECLEKGISVDLRSDLVTKELVERFHSKGLEVNVWTVDDEESRKKFESFGVDYLTTNILE